MIEFLLEIVFEFLFQFLFEVFVDAAGRGIAGALSNRFTRLAISSVFVAAVGFAGGFWWGTRLSEVRTTPPKLLYVSIALAFAFALLAVMRARSGERLGDDNPLAIRFGEPPWRKGYWTTTRLISFAVVNVGVALGVVAGFTPYTPG
jgi:hypothetical protein